jgi:hypothetical protein
MASEHMWAIAAPIMRDPWLTRLEEADPAVHAGCIRCAVRLNEWFIHPHPTAGLGMWCPRCGLVSPWVSHEEYRKQKENYDAK